MSTINGVEFYRKKGRLSKAELARRTGLSTACITRCESLDTLDGCRMDTILSISDSLNVSIDQLLEFHSADELERCDKAFRNLEKHDPSNPITIYRVRENLTMAELAQRMNSSSWGANQMCKRASVKDKYIQRLASWEGISMEEFLRIYTNTETMTEEENSCYGI